MSITFIDKNDTSISASEPIENDKPVYSPSLYTIIRNLSTYEPHEKPLECSTDESDSGDLVKTSEQEEQDLYEFGYIYIPRILLSVEEYIGLRDTAKAVLAWLMAKSRIIEQRVNLGIIGDETKHYPAIVATDKEIAFYSRIRGERNVSPYLTELKNAGFIRMRRKKNSEREDVSLYQLRTIQADKSGYIKFPIKALVSRAYIQLPNNAKALYMVMVSAHGSARVEAKDPFPSFNIAYSQMAKYGFSTPTIRKCINELETYRFITVDHGEQIPYTNRKKMNTYRLSTQFLDLF